MYRISESIRPRYYQFGPQIITKPQKHNKKDFGEALLSRGQKSKHFFRNKHVAEVQSLTRVSSFDPKVQIAMTFETQRFPVEFHVLAKIGSYIIINYTIKKARGQN